MGLVKERALLCLTPRYKVESGDWRTLPAIELEWSDAFERLIQKPFPAGFRRL